MWSYSYRCLYGKKASKGAVVSFLISTPQTGIDSILATYGLLGPIFTIFRPLVAFFSGILGGILTILLTKRDNLEFNIIEKEKENACTSNSCNCNSQKSENKFIKFYNYAFKEFLDDIAIEILIGIFLAGLISFIIPDDFFIKYNISNGLPAMLLMIIIGLPMYICATASIPIALSLMLKGISPGAAFVFLAVGPVTNAAAISVLLKILGKKIILIYIFASSVLAIIFGYLLDYIFIKFNVNFNAFLEQNTTLNEEKSIFAYFFSILFLLFLLMSITRIVKNKFNKIKKSG